MVIIILIIKIIIGIILLLKLLITIIIFINNFCTFTIQGQKNTQNMSVYSLEKICYMSTEKDAIL